MAYDLRQEPWIPWRRASGRVEWGPPAALADGLGDRAGDVVVGLATPRPDLDGALQEFLVGLLSAALRPADERAWRALWHMPPTRAALQAALDRLPNAFDLDGDGPRFFQDLSAADFAEAEPGSADQLLIDTPGDQGVRLNKDLFVKRARAAVLSRPAAAMALIAMQTYAPAGGSGHRTSLRGGGPLTTLVDPRVDAEGRPRAELQSLWAKLWANVETTEQLRGRTPPGSPAGDADRFPWLAPTRTSNAKAGGGPVRAGGADPLQAYFGLPRRIRLEFGGPGTCELTGRTDERTVVGFRMRNYGVQYDGWRHPLSPHYRTKVGEPWLPVHGQPGGLGWRDWVALALATPDAGGTREPAAAVAAFHRRGADLDLPTARLHAFGYDMDNMKARGWTEAALPMFAVPDPDRQRLLLDTARAVVDATGIAGAALLGAVKTALFREPDEAPGDLGAARAELWGATEAPFYDAMAAVAGAALPDGEAAAVAEARRRAFADTLRDRALEVFDRWCPAAGLPPDVLRRRVVARHELRGALLGLSPLGEKLFLTLGLAPPGGGRAARAAAAKAAGKRATRKAKEAP